MELIKKYIFPVLILLPTLYLGTGIFIYIFIIVISNYSLKTRNDINPIFLFFTLLYLLPYNLIGDVANSSIGNYIDNSFLISIPLYFYLINHKIWQGVDKKLANIVFLFFAVFIVSTIIPGFLSIFGMGHTVRLSQSINFFNSLIIALVAYHTFNNIRVFSRYTHLIIWLGLIVSTLGLFQYVFSFKFFETGYSSNVYRLTIIPYIDPVDLMPFFIVPLSFLFNILLSKNVYRINKTLVVVATLSLMLASVFTWSRSGLGTIITIFFISTILNKKKKHILTIATGALIFISFQSDIIGSIGDYSKDQSIRLQGEDNIIGRFLQWERGVFAIRGNLITGVGLGNEVEAAYKADYKNSMLANHYNIKDLYDNDTYMSLHNFYLNWILAMGVFIIPLMFLMYYHFLKNVRFIMKKGNKPEYYTFINSIVCSMVGLTIFFMQNTSFSFYYLFFFVALSFAIKRNIYLNNFKTNNHLLKSK
jgi:hypothetical protein